MIPQISSPGALSARIAGVALIALALGACNILPRLAQIGRAPDLSRIENPAGLAGKQPVQMPMPPTVEVARQPNSLWRPGSQQFLKDQRAAKEGDIVTVNIEIQDKAQISNTTTRSRIAAEDSSMSAMLGYQSSLHQILPEAIDPTNLVDLDSSGSTEGAGQVNRDETIELRVAALVTQVLPNGNLVIAGHQEVRVNFELRDLKVAGIIRPEDITSANTIEFDQIAEARIAYGGRGQITDVQQPRYGQQVFDILWPF
ncbi:MAG: flagellar basal body L-ring protein FlgH [Rhodospirillales bacterium]|nr:flagellar basal body L-ring protein FlgH [Rhodospirillales bacterium]MDH3790375.1 flagellar basal body L-ring protein FlgH [Rhodospirillales bacterium]MDH3910634.1 flagellar basal body L-ring protein FlgH [Rhodospirillales bacterium]MDH3919006.1 flagellar basal body L-ring protein FlgH [Rhodospirillales bacterium]MDH3965565.1 flagellar basal body L-ring protein FlgH [Rhodospirillales bacterium]